MAGGEDPSSGRRSSHELGVAPPRSRASAEFVRTCNQELVQRVGSKGSVASGTASASTQSNALLGAIPDDDQIHLRFQVSAWVNASFEPPSVLTKLKRSMSARERARGEAEQRQVCVWVFFCFLLCCLLCDAAVSVLCCATQAAARCATFAHARVACVISSKHTPPQKNPTTKNNNKKNNRSCTTSSARSRRARCSR